MADTIDLLIQAALDWEDAFTRSNIKGATREDYLNLARSRHRLHELVRTYREEMNNVNSE